ncbi:hypothetical protein IV203_006523 [Nitzschia inconspicua]|uniref:Uncharacterized protein n=1 Tax=Nitzschia inconspicua TaxID=303405 RepID=A0A9K3KB92_9STRA|nr:hypothetical protein IV203_006610 [Nitzschia inconspicua]KAG7340119.1 hypothetical protein IV203_006523 [Nitzschia inconspicua]
MILDQVGPTSSECWKAACGSAKPSEFVAEYKMHYHEREETAHKTQGLGQERSYERARRSVFWRRRQRGSRQRTKFHEVLEMIQSNPKRLDRKRLEQVRGIRGICCSHLSKHSALFDGFTHDDRWLEGKSRQ